jgi:hypothetical protein
MILYMTTPHRRPLDVTLVPRPHTCNFILMRRRPAWDRNAKRHVNSKWQHFRVSRPTWLQPNFRKLSAYHEIAMQHLIMLVRILATVGVTQPVTNHESDWRSFPSTEVLPPRPTMVGPHSFLSGIYAVHTAHYIINLPFHAQNLIY